MSAQGYSWHLTCLLAGLLLVPSSSVLAAQEQASTNDTAQASQVDPDAVAALDRMGKALRVMKAFSLVSDANTDIVLDDGQKVTLNAQVTYRVQQPNRLFVELKSDRRLRQLFYDGDTFTVYSPRLMYYASKEHVGKNLGDLAIGLAQDYGIEVPLADLFFWGTEYMPKDSLTSARYVGAGTLDGKSIEQYAFRQEGVDWQLWLSKDDALPQKLVITSLDDPAKPEYIARLHWNTGASPDPKSFTFVPPADAKRIEIVPIAVAVVETPEDK